ncbi:MAG: bZIP transcription factor [Haloarculaceae archaeon]
MCGNRVEELEARVNELEASVEGLTDELVECKVRLRELEGAVDEDLGFAPETPGPASEPAVEPSESPEEAEADSSNTEEADEEDNAETGSNDIIIA